MSLQINGHSTVPPGFRFHPTDEELVGYYLQNKVACKRIDLDVIKEIDLYKLEPWDLQEKCRIGSGEQNDWYFFSHKDKKYPTGTRTNRATTAGFWKATGRDKAIFTKFKLIGMRKTLVFYKGRAPNGQKSDWIMHEYRLEDDINNTSSNEEGWVVCRVFRKRNIVKQPRDYDVGYEEPPMRLLPELESVENFGTCSIFYNQMLNCKQEHMNLNCYNSLNESLPQLPSLESPKNSHTNASAAAMALLLQESSSLASFPALHTPAGMEDQQRMLVPQEDQFHGFHEELVTEWSVIDRVVSELNHNEEAKEIRPSTSDSLADMTMMLRFKHPADYLYGNDVDLWSYNQAQP